MESAALEEKIDLVLSSQTVLQRELSAHIADDVEMLTLIKGIDTALRGDLRSPGLVGDVAALKAGTIERGTDNRARMTAVVAVIVSLVASTGAVASALLK